MFLPDFSRQNLQKLILWHFKQQLQCLDMRKWSFIGKSIVSNYTALKKIILKSQSMSVTFLYVFWSLNSKIASVFPITSRFYRTEGGYFQSTIENQKIMIRKQWKLVIVSATSNESLFLHVIFKSGEYLYPNRLNCLSYFFLIGHLLWTKIYSFGSFILKNTRYKKS